MSARDDYPNLARRADPDFTAFYREVAEALDEIDYLRNDVSLMLSMLDSVGAEWPRR